MENWAVGEKSELLLKGRLGIETVEALSSRLKVLLADGTSPVLLDLSAVESVDVTFFQLLISFQNSLKAQGRVLQLGLLPEDHVVRVRARTFGLPGSLFADVEAKS